MTLACVAVIATGCIASNTLAHRKVTVPAMLVDAAMFSAGSCVGLDAQYRRDPDEARMVIGYGVAGAVWLSLVALAGK